MGNWGLGNLGKSDTNPAPNSALIESILAGFWDELIGIAAAKTGELTSRALHPPRSGRIGARPPGAGQLVRGGRPGIVFLLHPRNRLKSISSCREVAPCESAPSVSGPEECEF